MRLPARIVPNGTHGARQNHTGHRFPVVLSRIAEANAWPGWTDTQKHDFVELLLAPFRAEPTTIAELVEEGDRLHREK